MWRMFSEFGWGGEFARPSIPANAVTYLGEVVTHLGVIVTHG
jgi:hypothetical protein